MGFNIALSGLNAAQAELDVTSNNIANVETTGFKGSRAAFGDIYANSAFGNSDTAVGNGVLLQQVQQLFDQGNLDFTSQALDLAISGEGFFVLSPDQLSQERVYTRAGNFGVDENGFVVNSSNQYLQVFPVNEDGTVTATALSSTAPLQLPDTAGAPQATSEVDIGVNLPASANNLSVDAFDPDDSTTYSASTSITLYDSLGDSHIATAYFVKEPNLGTSGLQNTWGVFLTVTDNTGTVNVVDVYDGVGGAPSGEVNAGGVAYGVLSFDAQGVFQGTDPGTGIFTDQFSFLTNGADATQQVEFDFAGNTPTQFASAFSTNTLSQDGFTIGRLTGLSVDDQGLIQATYSNGQTQNVGKVALARFSNPQGLLQIGNTSWRSSTSSGEPIAGEAGTSSFGLIQSGALETSNVDLTKELVTLITSQRNFQANAKSIETANAVTQAIIQIR
ncbi:MAG: flagellar hook protein FlgE [Pseudomonadales bacterium]|nr:flagellar hook protein FlgE [Pseudomonadales bacterium]